MRKRKAPPEPTPQELAAAAEKARVNEFFRDVVGTLTTLTEAADPVRANQAIAWEFMKETRPHRKAVFDDVVYQFEAGTRLWVTYPNGEWYSLSPNDVPEIQGLGAAITTYDERYREHFQALLRTRAAEAKADRQVE